MPKDELIAEMKKATADSAELMREAFDIVRPEPRKYNGFPWLKPRAEWVEWYQHWRWFEAVMRIGAYESAALTLVPPCDKWPDGHADFTLDFQSGQCVCDFTCWASQGEDDSIESPLYVRASTPAIAICIAALRATERGEAGR